MGSHDFFWRWLDSVRKRATDQPGELSAFLESELGKLAGAQRGEISQSYFELLARLEKLEVWQACSLVSGLGCSDDSFSYFKNWILWQGRDIYSKFADNVDELAALIANGIVDASNPRLEELNVCGSMDPAVKANDLEPRGPLSFLDFQPAFDWRESTPASMGARLPELWKLFGATFTRNEADIEAELQSQPQVTDVPGLGRLKVGDRVHHKFGYGTGTIKEILLAHRGIALIDFPDGERRQQLAAESFEVAAPNS